MTVAELLAKLSEQGVELWVEGDKLRFRAPKDALTPELRAALAEQKEAVVQTLRERASKSVSYQPLSYSQQSMWFMHQTAPESAAYNSAFTAHICSEVNVGALRQSFQAIVDRHPILRTVYLQHDGVPVQETRGHIESYFEEIDGAGWSAEELQAQVNEAYQRPFDLEHGPVMRVHLFTVAPRDHVLLIVAHHIALDGWSIWLVLDDLATLYRSYNTGEAVSPPRLQAQYTDYIAWQTELLKSPEGERMELFWKEHLAGEQPILNLPTDHPRPNMPSYRGDVYRFALDEKLTGQLKELAKSQGVTLYMLLMAAWQVLLYRYSGQEEFLIGSPTSGRSRADFAKIVGHFINLVAVRADLTGQPTFLELVGRVRKTMLDTLANQDYPFPLVVQHVDRNPDPSRSPLFQVSFDLLQSFQQSGATAELVASNKPGARGDLGGMEVEAYPTPEQEGVLDLVMTLTEGRETIPGSIKYVTDLFEAASIERLVNHYIMLLEGVIANPQARIGELPLLTEAERHQMLVEWNATEMAFPEQASVHQLIEWQAEQSPDAVAVMYEGQQLTYRELNEKANQLAHHIRRLGVAPDTLVGLCIKRSLEMVVGMLGVLKAGGAYVPLDPTYPPDRLAYMLEDSHAPVLLTLAALEGVLPVYEGQIVRLDSDWARLEGESVENLPLITKPENLAYVIYTSGSTGKPKGVQLAHRGAANLAVWQKEMFRTAVGHRVLQVASLSFDAATWEMLMALGSGATLVVPAADAILVGDTLADVLKHNAITHATITPSAMATVTPEEVPALQVLLVAGEACTPDLVAKWSQGRRFFNAYGPTESTVCATIAELPAVEPFPPIGKPIGNFQIYVLDANGNPVPVGVVGELHIGGVGLSRGYLNRPELTAEKFIPNPFSSDPQARLYKSGDLARYRADGVIECLGRIDHQVKIRGFRIELGEIEAALAQYPGVQDTVVMAREDRNGVKRLVAYVAGQGLETRDMNNFLKGSLPVYMVPSDYVVLEKFPTTPNGKVDLKALPAPDESHREDAREYVSPRTPVEESIATIWAEVLGVERVGAYDDFFDLGGHSLKATQVSTRLRDLFSVDVPVRLLMDQPTLAELARAIEERMHGAKRRAADSPIVPISRDGKLPLSFAQERLWVVDQVMDTGSAYNMPIPIRLTGRLDIDALEHSLSEIIRRHEVLRTTFVTEGTEVTEKIAEAVRLTIPVVDISDINASEQQSHIDSWMREVVQSTFDLSKGALVRANLLRLGEDDHILALNMHHIVSDGWSIGVFVREFTALYTAYAAGEESPLAELPVQYADFAAWQRQVLSGEALGDDLAYWTNHLSGKLPVLSLPTDRPRPANQTFSGMLHTFHIPQGVTQRLKALSREEKGTLFMTLLAAFEVLMWRYSGQEDVIVGTPIANRQRKEVEGLIGFFVNTLALRTDLSGDPSFVELVKRVREGALGAYAHQDMPFEKLVEALKPERSGSYTPVFQVMFVLQNAPLGAVELPELKVTPLQVDLGASKFDLTMYLQEEAGGMVGQVEFNTDLFNLTTIEQLENQFITLLESIVTAPANPISQLSLLTADEQQKVLVDWNATEAEYPHDTTLPQMFEAQVERTPDAVAMIFGDERLTYRELNARANQLAHYLQGLGVGNETLVGVSMERSLDLIVALVGILKAGGAYVALDPHYPQDRLAFILEDAGLSVVLTQSHVAANLPPNHARLVLMDIDWPTVAQQPQDNLSVELNIDNLAYVTYTSGSTGRPKGVMACHRGAINRFNWMWQTYPYGWDEVNCQKTSLNFVDSLWENFGALLQGIPTVVIPDDVGKDPVRLIEMLSVNHVTRITLVPSLLRAMLDSGRIGMLRELKYWITSGEAIAVELLKRFREALPDSTLINLYGSSEVAADVTYFDAKDYHDQASVPIGKPIANSQIYLVDSQMRPVPVGTAGELLVGGAGLARGYLNRPELTAEKFVPNPFSDDLYARLYKTGDLARYLSDGTIEYVGRIDHQIKLRGFRIELGEVETAVAEHTAVKEALVTLREDTPGDPRLVAYVVGTADLSIADLRTYLRAKLPDYMVPGAFVVLAAMPLTPNGKVNRLALPVPEVTERESERGFVNPRTPVEESIAAIWSDVLGIERVGVYDDFFDLGGHSLRATQVVGRLRDVFGVDIPVRALLDQPIMADLSQAVEDRLHGTNGQKTENPITIVSREGKVALSSAQERMWIIDQMMHTGAAYNIPAVVRLKGKLNIEALEHSLTEIVRRHEVLRTTYYGADGGVEQKIAEPGQVSIPMWEAEDSTEAQINAWIQEETENVFDLAEGPLVRARLLHLSDDDHVLVLNMHHIVSDGWSIGVLVREFTALYAAYVAGEESPLPELPIQYADFAAWQREILSDEGLAEDTAYWTKHLGGSLPVLALPTDRPRPAIQTFPGAVHSFQISPQVTDGLKGLSRREKGTLFMTLLAAFKVLMWRYSGQEDVIVGTPIANRQRAEIEGLIGFFVNTLALRTDLSGDPSFAELVKRVREVALGAYAHQNMPFEKLVEVLKPERSVSYSPIFQVMFVLQNAPLGTVEMPDLTVTPMEFDVGAAKFDLTLTMREENGGMIGQIEYNTDLFDPITMEEMERHFALLLESAIAQPNTPISALKLLSEEERRHILLDWNHTAVDYPHDIVLHQLFEAQVERTPDAVAVIFEDQQLTYRELNARANQLARYLRGLGVGADTMVGVSMERSLEMVISLYAILKAGGAYVPMDPEYPPARLAYMLQDSNVPVLLTQERLIASLPEHGAKVISLDTGWDAIAQESVENLPITIQPDNLAYMIYTSGSTGNPKGAMNAHRGIVNRLLWMQDAFKLDASDRVLQKTPFSFDVSVWEFFWTLFTGAQLVVARPGGHRDPAYLVNLIIEQGITTLHFVPSMLELFIKEAGVEACTSIRRVICSGEALSLELQNRFFERLNTELQNLYGPTEAAVDVTWWECQPNSSLRVLPIGKPIANTQMYILDKHKEPVPIGVGGELFIAGIQVGKGYLNRPELTAEKFIADPFSSRPGAKLYRTGDLARYLRDGNIEYLGRIDFQIKLRGFRIELGEIEAALAQYPGVRESLVMLREDTPSDKRLVGYLVTNAPPTPNDLRNYLKDKLPDYMVPAAFVMLDSMPLSPNGKADRKALPKPEYGQTERSQAAVAPQTATEQTVLEVWQAILGFEQIGIYDNFFDLGGHSLQAIEVVGKMAEKTGVKIDPTMLRFQTLGQLAASYDEQLAQGITPAAAEPEADSGLAQKLFKAFRRGGK